MQKAQEPVAHQVQKARKDEKPIEVDEEKSKEIMDPEFWQGVLENLLDIYSQ